jgi:plasmid stabilization system protein ParE
MKVRYAVRAKRDLEEIFPYLDERSPAAAQSVKQLIEQRIASLGDFPFIAPEADEPGIRELTTFDIPTKFITKSTITKFGSFTFDIRHVVHSPKADDTRIVLVYRIVGMTNSAPSLVPDGQRAVTVLVLV